MTLSAALDSGLALSGGGRRFTSKRVIGMLVVRRQFKREGPRGLIHGRVEGEAVEVGGEQ